MNIDELFLKKDLKRIMFISGIDYRLFEEM